MDDSTLTSSPHAPRLDVVNLELSLGGNRVLHGLNLRLSRREVMACMGRSGCGKSSMLKSLALFLQPQSGQVRLDGKLVFDNGRALVDPRRHRERVCLVFQEQSLFPNLTGWENIIFAAVRRGRPRVEVEKDARRLADNFRLSRELLARYPQSYSGGQSQRVALIRALVLSPEVLLLDEPTSALDPESIASVIEAIQQLRVESASMDLAVILVTHLPGFAQEIADRIVFMEGGTIVEDHPADRFFSGATHPAVEAFAKRFRFAM